MTSGPRTLREHADELRRAADRFTLLRLRVSNVILEATRSEDAHTRASAAAVHERWSTTEYPELGRIAGGLRASATRLDQTATDREVTSGRRMGGYGGAGFLGRGDEARRHVGEVARFVGTQRGASIGGYPLAPGDADGHLDADGDLMGGATMPAGAAPPSGMRGFLPHPSHTVGAPTPDYEDE